MAKFTIVVVCAVLGVATASPGVVSPFGGVPLAYASQLPYSAPLAYSPSLAYTSPVAYGLSSGGSSRIDIQNNYNVAPQYAVPFGAAPFAYSAAAPFAARISAPYAVSAPLAAAPLSYNAPLLQHAQFGGIPLAAGPLAAAPLTAAPLTAAPLAAARISAAPLAAAPVAAAPLTTAPVAAARLAAAPLAAAPLPAAPVAAPGPLAAKIVSPVPAAFAPSPFAPAQLRYSAPLLSNYNAPLFASPLSYAFPGQLNGLPFAARLAAAPVAPFGTPITAAPAPAPVAGAPPTTQLTAVSEADPEDDSEVVNARLQSESPSDIAEGRVIATPAPVDGPQAAPRDASEATQSPVAPVRKN